MFRSIRWNLLGWQAMILVAVVVGFGATLFFRIRYATLEQVDADLLGAAQVVVTKLQQTGSPQHLEIPEAYRYRFGDDSADAPYLAVWDAQGRVQTHVPRRSRRSSACVSTSRRRRPSSVLSTRSRAVPGSDRPWPGRLTGSRRSPDRARAE